MQTLFSFINFEYHFNGNFLRLPFLPFLGDFPNPPDKWSPKISGLWLCQWVKKWIVFYLILDDDTAADGW